MNSKKRIFVAVVSFVLLCAVLVTSVLAATDLTTAAKTAEDLLDKSSTEFGTVLSKGFSNLESITEYKDFADGTSKSSSNKGMFGSTFTSGAVVGNCESVITDANKYFRVYHGYGIAPGSSTRTAYAYLGLNSSEGSSAGYRYADNDFIVIDFDYTVDQYIYTADYTYTPEGADAPVTVKAGTLTTEPVEGASYRLAYPESGQSFTFMNRATGVNVGNDVYMQVNPTTGLFSHSAGGKFMPLSTELGHWNHITWVVQLDTRVEYEGGTAPVSYKDYEAIVAELPEGTAAPKITKHYLGYSKIHAYVDGMYVGSQVLVGSNDVSKAGAALAKLGLSEVRFNYPGTDYSSQAFDNVTSHYYNKGYGGPLANAFNDISNPPESLFGLTDIVYTSDYYCSAPNSVNAAAVTSTVNGTPNTVYYKTVMEAASALRPNDVLTLASGVNLLGKLPAVPFYLVYDSTSYVAVTSHNKYTVESNETGTIAYFDLAPYKSSEFTEYLTSDYLCYPNTAAGQSTNPNKGSVYFFSNLLVPGKSTGVIQSGKNDEGTNGFLRFWYDPDIEEMKDLNKGHDTGFDIYYGTDGKDPASFALVNNKYVVLSLDMMSDKYLDANNNVTAEVTDKLAYNNNYTFGSMYSGFLTSKSSSVSNFFNSREIKTVYDSTAKQWYIEFAGQKLAYLSKTAGEWNHISLVISIDNTVVCDNGLTVPYSEAVAKGYKIVETNLINSKITAYVNGVKSSDLDFINSSKVNSNPESEYMLNDSAFSYDDIMIWRQRLQPSNPTTCPYYSIAFDNCSITFYDDTYKGSLDDYFRAENGSVSVNSDVDGIAAFDRNHFGGAAYGFPGTDNTVITVQNTLNTIDGTFLGKTYSYSDIGNAAADIQPGDKVTVADGKNVADFVPECEFTVLLGEGSSFALAPTVFNYRTEETEGGLRVVENTKDVHITYVDENGAELKTQDWYVRQELELIAFADFDDPKNPIYNLGAVYYYNDEVVDGTNPLSFDTAGDYTITVKMERVILDVQYLFNYDIAYKFVSYFYIPLTDTDGNVLASVKNGSTTYTKGSSVGDGDGYVNISEKTLYACIASYPSPTNVDNVTNYSLTFTINGQDYETNVKGYSIATYLKRVVELYGSDAPTKKLAVNIARYCDEMIRFTKNETDYSSSVTSIWMPNGVVSDLVINTESETVMNMIRDEAEFADITGDVTTYIKGATYHIGAGAFPCFALIPQNPSDVLSPDDKTDYVIKSVSIDYMGFMNEGAKYTYLYEDCAPGTADDGESFGQNWSRGTGYLVNLNDNLHAYYLRGNMTIKINLKSGETVTCKYNLAKYIVETEGVANDGVHADNAVAKALWAYAYAAAEYMINEYTGPTAK